METVSCLAIGDGAVGKTSLLVTFSQDKFEESYEPTVFDNYETHLEIDKEAIQLLLWDSSGQEEYDRIRPLSYGKADIIMLCFSIVSPDSYDNITQKWILESDHYAKNLPKILVGTKMDLRDDKKVCAELEERDSKPTTKEDGEKLAKKIGAKYYLECSSLTREGVKNVFDKAARIVLNKEPNQACCTIL